MFRAHSAGRGAYLHTHLLAGRAGVERGLLDSSWLVRAGRHMLAASVCAAFCHQGSSPGLDGATLTFSCLCLPRDLPVPFPPCAGGPVRHGGHQLRHGNIPWQVRPAPSLLHTALRRRPCCAPGARSHPQLCAEQPGGRLCGPWYACRVPVCLPCFLSSAPRSVVHPLARPLPCSATNLGEYHHHKPTHHASSFEGCNIFKFNHDRSRINEIKGARAGWA